MKRIFYDDNCPFCVRVVGVLKHLDKKDQYTFSSLNGQKARTLFAGNYGFLRKKKSIVFLEGKRVWVRANAVLRLFWLIGKGPWKYLGSLFVLPGIFINPIYRLMALIIK